MRRALVIAATILIGAAVGGSVNGYAHGQALAAQHGGQMQDAHGHWLECLVRGDILSVFVTDAHGRPVPATLVSGTATVLVAGQPTKVPLAPGAENELSARLPGPAAGKVTAAVSLKIGDETLTARFAAVPVSQ